jgi:hypothetical protein
MITAHSRTGLDPHWLALIYSGLRHKIGRLFPLSNCHNVNSRAETVAHRLPANRPRTGGSGEDKPGARRPQPVNVLPPV